MKYLRILAVVLAVFICLSAGYAEEAAGGGSDLFKIGSGLDTEELEEEIEEATDGVDDTGDDSDLYDAVLLADLDVDAGEWLLSSDLRAMLAVIMGYELYLNADFDTETLSNTYGQPTIYINVPSDLEDLAVGAMFFYTDAELVISVTYLPILGQYTAFQSELNLDPAIAMGALEREGLFAEYYEVTSDDYYTAISLIDDALNAE